MYYSSLDTKLEYKFRQILQASVSLPVKTSKGPWQLSYLLTGDRREI